MRYWKLNYDSFFFFLYNYFTNRVLFYKLGVKVWGGGGVAVAVICVGVPTSGAGICSSGPISCTCRRDSHHRSSAWGFYPTTFRRDLPNERTPTTRVWSSATSSCPWIWQRIPGAWRWTFWDILFISRNSRAEDSIVMTLSWKQVERVREIVRGWFLFARVGKPVVVKTLVFWEGRRFRLVKVFICLFPLVEQLGFTSAVGVP